MTRPQANRSRWLTVGLLVVLALLLALGGWLLVISLSGPQTIEIVISEPVGEDMYYDAVADDVASSGVATIPATLKFEASRSLVRRDSARRCCCGPGRCVAYAKRRRQPSRTGGDRSIRQFRLADPDDPQTDDARACRQHASRMPGGRSESWGVKSRREAPGRLGQGCAINQCLVSGWRVAKRRRHVAAGVSLRSMCGQSVS